ncbi:MAG: bifunctional lysine-specific demethylase and histidyl-hydroxylase [Pseudonocardiales bacterium]|nr:bifunctional lysine-specific demethylase and histidyl-hydroxylase [Pseudonocardiales bacterium]
MSTRTSNDGGAGGAALRRCVSCPPDEFGEKHWGRAPLLTRAAELTGGFGDLLDADAVDELVSRRGLRTPFLRMAKDGTVLPAARFTRGGGAGASIADQAADDKVLATIADGATLVLQALHRTWPPLVHFGSRLAAELGHPVQINAYITPPQNQGFAPHYDVHDVFVLQVAGRKQWTIHPPVVEAPLDDQPWEQRRAEVAARAAEAPLIDTVLEPGDALYLPRGTVHAAQAQGELSIHLTVGVHPVTRYQLVRHLLDLVQDDPELRAALPMGVDLSDPAVLSEHLTATVDLLRARVGAVEPADVARRVGENLMRRTRPEPIGPLAQLAAAATLEPTTRLRLRAGLRARLDGAGEQLRLVLLDRTIALPAATSDALKVVLAGAAVTPAELPGLDGDEQLTFAARLLREGVLVPASMES